MGYLMELSVNLCKTQNISHVKTELYKKAEECKVLDYYSMYEFVGENRQIHRNHCILTFTFRDHKELIVAFIKFVKKISYVNIESFGYDNTIFKLMYASKKYLNMMDKNSVKEYLEARRNKTLFEQDSIILKAILKKR